MNYEPNDYNSLIEKTQFLNDYINDFSSIDYISSTSESKDDLERVEDIINSKLKNLESANSIINDVYSVIDSDFFTKQKMYVELVSIGYEEELFPFYDWLKSFELKNWTVNNSWLNNISNIAKSVNGNITYIQNISYFYDIASKYSDKSYFEVFSMCRLAFKNNKQVLTTEQQDEAFHRFIFGESLNNFLYSINEKTIIYPFSPILKKDNQILIAYINDLFENIENNDEAIKEIMQFISTQKLLPEYNNFINSFVDSIISVEKGNNFLFKGSNNQYNKDIYQRYNAFIKLFECDIDYNLEITPYVVKKLEEVKKYIITSKKDEFNNMILELDNGYYAYILNSKLPEKPLSKNKNKI